MKIIAELEERA